MGIINLFGASGHAKVLIDIINSQGDEVGYLYDDNPHNDHINGLMVATPDDVEVKGPLIVSIGSNESRKKVSERYKVCFARGIHPSAIISPSTVIKEGTVIMQGAIVQADVRIGRHCIINTGATIDHECQIEDFVHIAPGSTLCGNVTIGEGSFIGTRTTIIQGVKIGKWCTIGAGSVVIRDIPDGVTAYGNPCKIRRTNMTSTDYMPQTNIHSAGL